MPRKTARKFLFVPTAHGPGYYNVHVLTCSAAKREWQTNNSQGRAKWDAYDVREAATAKAAVAAYIEGLEAGGHEPGAFQPSDFWLHPCCKKEEAP